MRPNKQSTRTSKSIAVSKLDKEIQKIEAAIVQREREGLRASFRAFVEQAWPIVEPGSVFVPGLHIDAICEHLQAVSDRQIRKLLINVQPRSGKLLAHSTPVLTHNRGWVTHGDLVPGDQVYGRNGQPTRVVAISEEDWATLDVVFSNGARIKAHPNHEWTVYGRPHQKEITRETKWFAAREERYQVVEHDAYIWAVEEAEPELGRCIQVEADDGIYLVGKELIPTHNSTIVSVLFPAWLWTHSPEERVLSASYSESLSMRDAVTARRVIDTDWYRARWPEVVLMDDQNTKKVYENTALGRRQVTSVDGPVTGLGGSILILDDPHNVKEADSATIREAAVQWFREAWSTRKNPGGRGACQVVVMQRVHEQDVSGYCLQEGDWDHLCLPTEYEGEKKPPTSIGWVDKRTEYGELMWPELHGTPDGRQALEDLKKTMGSYSVAGQLQQRPVPRGGGTFRMEWCRFWFDPDLGYPEAVRAPTKDGGFVELAQKPLPRLSPESYLHSWDMAYKAKAKNDYVVGQVWAIGHEDPANRYLVHQERGHLDFVASKAAVVRMYEEYPSNQILVEARANGEAILSELSNTVPGLISIDPSYGDKVSRASSIAPTFEAGNVWLPHPAQFPWVQTFLDELCSFPKSKNDDQVDAMSQALHRLRESTVVEIDAEAIVITGSRSNPWLI